MEYIKKHRNMLIFLCIILIIGIIFGIIIGIRSNEDMRNSLINGLGEFKNIGSSIKINNIWSHLIIISLLIILSSTFIGYIVNIIYLFYIGLGIGFNIFSFTLVYGFKGLLFSLVYNLFIKLLFICLLFILIIKLFYLGKNIVGYLIYKENYLKRAFLFNYKGCFIISFFILFSDVMYYFFGLGVMKYLVNIL